ncbi:hypothetical protein DKX38_029040 [Salix brachista]|uniref:Squalene monooxygenase n=1 Tax=Salix brachista TaxID=2182728 RepID=A0A5N5IZR2_9ROSI|nr:hypothetical protein DKX38_029040 [Salix brachista]
MFCLVHRIRQQMRSYDGWRVNVVERDLTEPDRIVGEFLQVGGCIKLAELGLEDCLDGSDSQTVFSFAAVHKDGKRSAISYPSNASGRGFHHGRFVQKLREKAASLPNKRPISLWIRIRDVTNQHSCEHKIFFETKGVYGYYKA